MMNRLRWASCLLCAVLPACGGRLIESSTPLVISTDSLPNEIVDDSYFARLAVDEEGVSASWQVAAGELPPGLALDEERGTIGGTPVTAGTFDFTIRVEENALVSRSGRKGFSITFIERLQVNPNLETARIDEPYEDTFRLSGGVEPYTFDMVGLPAGLEIDEETGTVSGTPLVANENLQIEITVTDSGDPQQSAFAGGFLVILPRNVSISTELVPDGRVGRTYVETLEAIDGTEPYTWAIIAGVLPDGLRLDLDSGVISGVPGKDQTATFTVEVTDSGGLQTSSTQEFVVRIDP